MPALKLVKVVNPKDDTKSMLINQIDFDKNPKKYTLWENRLSLPKSDPGPDIDSTPDPGLDSDPTVKEDPTPGPKPKTKRGRKKKNPALKILDESVGSEIGESLSDE